MSRVQHCKGIRPVKKMDVGGDDLTGVLHVLQLRLSPPLPSSLALIKSRMETFWLPANPGPPAKWPLNRRERPRVE